MGTSQSSSSSSSSNVVPPILVTEIFSRLPLPDVEIVPWVRKKKKAFINPPKKRRRKKRKSKGAHFHIDSSRK
jgi:hypothetical protein